MATLQIGSGSLSLSNDLLSSTLYSLRDEAVDALFQKTPFLTNAKQYDGVEEKDGGHSIVVPLMVSDHSNITQLTGNGFNVLDLSAADVLTTALYGWCDFVEPISISGVEETVNRGEDAVVDVLKSRMTNVTGKLKREIEKQIIANNSSVLTNLNSLYGGYSGNAVNNGFIYLDTSGTAGTVGGLARSVSTGLANQVVSDSGSTLIESLLTAQMDAEHYTVEGQTDLMIAGPTAFAKYRSELFPQEQYTSKRDLDGGVANITFSGIPMIRSRWMDSSKSTGASSTLDRTIYGVNFAGIKVVFDRDANFKIYDFLDVPQQVAKVAKCRVRMQLIASHLASQFAVIAAGV